MDLNVKIDETKLLDDLRNRALDQARIMMSNQLGALFRPKGFWKEEPGKMWSHITDHMEALITDPQTTARINNLIQTHWNTLLDAEVMKAMQRAAAKAANIKVQELKP